MSLRELENLYISKKLLKIAKSFREQQKDTLTPFISEFPYMVKIPPLKWQPIKEMHSRAELIRAFLQRIAAGLKTQEVKETEATATNK